MASDVTWLWLLAIPVALVLLDQLAQRNSWRLGAWTQYLPLPALYKVRGGHVIDLSHTWCEECKTAFRYATPHVTYIRPYDLPPGSAIGIVVLCQKCRSAIGPDLTMQRYAEWWLAKRDRDLERGLTPDPREFDDIRAALRTGG